MPIAHKNPDTGATEYSEGVGSGTTPGNPHRGKSILQDGNLVNAGNPLHVQSSDLAGRIGGTSDGAAANDTANASLISLTKRGLQHL
ncbi:MAG TPA: hypothetical protein VEA41_07960, partial [Salinarimonas sp.]|nr:hypothetical protein [Salinarimonas sp.]